MSVFRLSSGLMTLMLGMTLTAGPLHAQKINPLLIDKDLREATKPVTKPSSVPNLILPKAGQMPENAAATKFEFDDITIEGARAIPEADLLKFWPFAPGETSSVADVFALAEDITSLYRNAGYALSFAIIPAQAIDSGRFTIQIIEGRLEGLSIVGNRISDLVRSRILDGFSVINPSQPTKIAELERFLLLVNDLPGITARGTISPGETAETSLLTLDVTQTRFDGGVSYNNFLSESLGREATIIDLKAFNQWTGRDALHISLKSAPDIAVYRSSSVNYETYIGSDGLLFEAAASESITRPKKGDLVALDFSSVAYNQSIGIRMPWKRSRNSNVNIGAALSGSHTVSKNGDSVTSEDKIRIASIYAEYDVSHSRGATTNIRLQVNRGMKALGARGDSRANARPNFVTYELSGAHQNPLFANDSGSLIGALTFRGQSIGSANPLLANAECSFGGQQFGVGFDAGALSGENCLLGSARITWQQNVRDQAAAFVGQAQYYLRYDSGQLRQEGPLAAGEKRSVKASSLGLGVQLVMRNGVAFFLESSKQVTRSDDTKKRDKSRTHASVHFGF